MKYLLLLFTLFYTLYAFDTRTHVFISQEIINDLSDSKLTIKPYGEFKVDQNIVDAILNNQSTYRMGNIGPDGFPDVIGGQVTTHPGLEDGYIDDESSLTHGWKSDEWFKFVLQKAKTPQEIAFAYGYIAHGASDTFAHTYVNMYSGDIFDMNDGETDVEKRHIFLEKYISDRLPSIKNSQGDEIGKAYELVATNDQLPIEFIKNTLIMNQDVSKQYKLSSTASYLAKMYEFRQKVEALGIKYAPATINPFATYDENSYTFTQAWLKKIDQAINEYIKTSSLMSREFLKVTDSSSYSKLQDWFACYADAFSDPSTIVSNISSTTCKSTNVVKLDSNTYKLSLGNFPLLNKLSTLPIFEQFDSLKNSLGYEIVDLLNVAALEIITVKEKKVSEDSLNKQFSMDESDKNLLMINDISKRVNAEMNLKDGILDVNSYNVLYDAIVLTKLSLLGKDALNTLLERAKVSQYKTFSKSDEIFNITFNAIKTIDGNHQWLETAPPYPRTTGSIDVLWPNKREYGYAHTKTTGFALYNNPYIRDKVFNKIFKGPLAQGLETPSVLNLDDILEKKYPYVTCKSNPFPNGIDDKKCLDDNRSDSNISGTQDDNNSDYTTWFDQLLDDVSTYFDQPFNEWLNLLMKQLYSYGEELVLSVTSTTEDDGSTTVEVVTKINDKGITF